MKPHPYRQAFEARDVDGLVALLADDVVFHSPVIADPGFDGRESVAALLEIAVDAATDVEYTHDIGDDGAHILIADGRMLGQPFKATTLLEYNGEGKIREIWVMARPLKGVTAIAEAIGSQLGKREGSGRERAVRVAVKPLRGMAAVADRTGSRVIAALNRSTS